MGWLPRIGTRFSTGFRWQNAVAIRLREYGARRKRLAYKPPPNYREPIVFALLKSQRIAGTTLNTGDSQIAVSHVPY